jgi:site-specific recombinase XerD
MKTNISNTPEGQRVLLSFERRLRVANRSDQTIINYVRSLRALMDFHQSFPSELEIDQVIDFLNDLQVEKERNWRTIKIYVAGLRWYYQHMANQVDLAMQIPYPKEKPSLPKVLSREELTRLFDSCLNPKHRVMFRLLYSSGLRRGEILRLTTNDLITKDGKCQIRINCSKGGKDRYTVLSKKVLVELREVNLHILRHCFASHALEEGINLKTLQYLMGHSTVRTTMIYLHLSEVPLSKAFSPLDAWEQ